MVLGLGKMNLFYQSGLKQRTHFSMQSLKMITIRAQFCFLDVLTNMKSQLDTDTHTFLRTMSMKGCAVHRILFRARGNVLYVCVFIYHNFIIHQFFTSEFVFSNLIIILLV